MSADILGVANVMRTAEQEQELPRIQAPRPAVGWNPGKFAQEQIRGLVRQVFSASETRAVRQIVVSAADPETDVRNICRQVGESLALETLGGIAVVGEYPQLSGDWRTFQDASRDCNIPLRDVAARMRGNLWLVPACQSDHSTESLHKYLWKIRREFEYSIVAAPQAGSNEAATIGMFADGMIVVLSARYTRRATARRIKESLQTSQVRLLGTVLSDREFPIPERIYRRL